MLARTELKRPLLALPRSSSESAAFAPSCLFERTAHATGEPSSALTAAVSTSGDGIIDCTGPCAPSLSSTCGFAVRQSQADGSSRRFSGHVQIWQDDGEQVLRVFSGAVALQIPLPSALVAIGSIKALNCIVLVWCLELVFSVLTPIKWWAAAGTGLPPPVPPPQLAPASPPPPHPPPGPPYASLYSTLQLCDNQNDLQTVLSRSSDVVYAGETYCLVQLVFNLPLGAMLIEHALYQNGTLVSIAAGTRARLLVQPWLPAMVQFPYTFPVVGLVLLESVSVFRLGSLNLTTSSGGTQRTSTWSLPLLSASAGSSSAPNVRIAQRAEFDISAVVIGAAAPRKELTARFRAPEELAMLSASLASAQFVTRAALPPLKNPGALVSM